MVKWPCKITLSVSRRAGIQTKTAWFLSLCFTALQGCLAHCISLSTIIQYYWYLSTIREASATNVTETFLKLLFSPSLRTLNRWLPITKLCVVSHSPFVLPTPFLKIFPLLLQWKNHLFVNSIEWMHVWDWDFQPFFQSLAKVLIIHWGGLRYLCSVFGQDTKTANDDSQELVCPVVLGIFYSSQKAGDGIAHWKQLF